MKSEIERWGRVIAAIGIKTGMRHPRIIDAGGH